MDRSSADSARQLFRRLFSPATRPAVERLLASSIRLANDIGQATWSVTLHPDSIRLNVGPAEALSLWQDSLGICFDGPRSTRSALRRAAIDMYQKTPIYPSVSTTNCRAEPDAGQLSEALRIIGDGHAQFIRNAATTKKGLPRKTPYYTSYSPGVIRYLHQRTDPELSFAPHPIEPTDGQVGDVFPGRGIDQAITTTQRIGQERFRRGLIDQWACCTITGCSQHELLVASHIKPWAVATEQERVNPNNGLLLTATLDAAFDSGLITIDETGILIASPELDPAAAASAGISAGVRVQGITRAHQAFLKYHRERRFRPGPQP